jgi:hypothetical protein
MTIVFAVQIGQTADLQTIERYLAALREPPATSAEIVSVIHHGEIARPRTIQITIPAALQPGV